MGFPGGSAGKEPVCQYRRCKRCKFNPWVGKISWRRKWLPTPVFLPGKSHDRGAWWATVYGVAKSWTQPSTHTATYWFCGSRWLISSDFLYLRLLSWYPLDSSQAATNFEAGGLMLTLVGGWSLVTWGGWALGRVGAPSPTGMPLFPIPRRRRFLDGMLGHTTWTWPSGSLCGEWSGLGGQTSGLRVSMEGQRKYDYFIPYWAVFHTCSRAEAKRGTLVLFFKRTLFLNLFLIGG